MAYEFLVGWRYLYTGRRSRAVWVGFALALAVCLVGIALFYFSGSAEQHGLAKGAGAVLTLAGGIGMAASLLLGLFSTFTAVSILGLSIGIAILIWVLSVTSGFEEEFRNRVLGVNAHIVVIKYGQDFYEYREVMKTSKKIEGVQAAAPFTLTDMMVAKGNRLANVLVKGVDPKLVGTVLEMPEQVEIPKGTTSKDMPRLLLSSKDAKGKAAADMPTVILGRELAEKLDVKVGEPVRLISPLTAMDGTAIPGTAEMPRSVDFRVSGIFYSGFNEYDTRLVYVHMRESQSFFNQGDVVYGVELKVDDVYNARPLAKTISAALHAMADRDETLYRTIDWSELNRNLFTALRIQKLVLQIIFGFIVVVGAFNVLAALAMLVIRKTREIAILKSMGVSPMGIARIFQSAGIIVWLIGTSLGLAWGYLGCLLLRRYGFPLEAKVYLISELPIKMDISEFLLTAAFALGVCFLATLYPALRAARLHPVDGLRYE
jgi:lipoprotein-releasing system permease protein